MIAIIRSLVISVLCVQFAFEPLAMANQQNQLRQDLIKQLADMQKGKKDLTFGEYFKKIENKLPPEIKRELELLAKTYGKQVLPRLTVIDKNNSSPNHVTILAEQGKRSMKLDLSPDGDVRVNGKTFGRSDLRDLRVYARKFASAFPDSFSLTQKVRGLKGERLTLTYDEVMALPFERQTAYFMHLREMTLAADKVLATRSRSPASEGKIKKLDQKLDEKEKSKKKADEVSSFIMKLITGDEVNAATRSGLLGKPCIIAGNFSTFEDNKRGGVSCGGAKDSSDVAQPPIVACRKNRALKVGCGEEMFVDPVAGGQLCLENTAAGWDHATAECDKKNPVKNADGSDNKELQRKTAKGILDNLYEKGKGGKLTKDSIKLFNERYDRAIKEAVKVCTAAQELGGDQFQKEACDTLNNRWFQLDDSDIEDGTAVVPPEEPPAPTAAASGDDKTWLWILLGIVALGTFLCLVWFCKGKDGGTPGNYPQPSPAPQDPTPDTPMHKPDHGTNQGGTATGG